MRLMRGHPSGFGGFPRGAFWRRPFGENQTTGSAAAGSVERTRCRGPSNRSALQAYPGLMRECRRNLVHWTPDLGNGDVWLEELRLSG